MPDQPDNYRLGPVTLHFTPMEPVEDSEEDRVNNDEPVEAGIDSAESTDSTRVATWDATGELVLISAREWHAVNADQELLGEESVLSEVQRLTSERMARDLDEMMLNGLRGAEAGSELRDRLFPNGGVLNDEQSDRFVRLLHEERSLNSILGLEEEVKKPTPPAKHRRIRL